MKDNRTPQARLTDNLFAAFFISFLAGYILIGNHLPNRLYEWAVILAIPASLAAMWLCRRAADHLAQLWISRGGSR
jgi:uncharacterized membrane protein YfcA